MLGTWTVCQENLWHVDCNQQTHRGRAIQAFGSHIMPPCARQEAIIGLKVYPVGFESCFGMVLPYCFLILPFWNRNIHIVPLHLGSMYLNFCFCLFFVFLDFTAEFALSLRFCTWTFEQVSNAGTVNNLETLGEGKCICTVRWT
jgi:hypothetical protein